MVSCCPQACAVVGDGDGQRVIVVAHGHPAAPGVGVPDGVGHRLHHDAVRRDLDCGWQHRHVFGCEHAGGELGPGGQPVGSLGARVGQAEFIQGWWAQAFDEAADIEDRSADLLAQIVQLV